MAAIEGAGVACVGRTSRGIASALLAGVEEADVAAVAMEAAVVVGVLLAGIAVDGAGACVAGEGCGLLWIFSATGAETVVAGVITDDAAGGLAGDGGTAVAVGAAAVCSTGADA